MLWEASPGEGKGTGGTGAARSGTGAFLPHEGMPAASRGRIWSSHTHTPSPAFAHACAGLRISGQAQPGDSRRDSRQDSHRDSHRDAQEWEKPAGCCRSPAAEPHAAPQQPGGMDESCSKRRPRLPPSPALPAPRDGHRPPPRCPPRTPGLTERLPPPSGAGGRPPCTRGTAAASSGDGRARWCGALGGGQDPARRRWSDRTPPARGQQWGPQRAPRGGRSGPFRWGLIDSWRMNIPIM